MSGRLAGKTAIITGAGQGIGEAIAVAFVAQGARVVIAERNPETGAAVAERLRAEGGAAVFVHTDVADRASVEAMALAAEQAFGPVDILVNNAGINVAKEPLSLTDEIGRASCRERV